MKIVNILAVVVVAALLLYMVYPKSPGEQERSRDETILRAGLPDLDGKMQAIYQWKGKVLVVNFWASWCPPCRAEIPGFIELQKKYRDKGLVFVGIALDSPDKAAAFAKKIGVNYPVLIDRNSTVLNLSGLPYTVVFDRNGAVVATHSGAWSEEKLDDIVGKFL